MPVHAIVGWVMLVIIFVIAIAWVIWENKVGADYEKKKRELQEMVESSTRKSKTKRGKHGKV